ncbi:MAG: hypothetical protein ACRERU_15755 [Methylococcales bacterium]
MKKHCKELVENGELPEIDTASSAQAVVALLEGGILFAKLRNDPELILTLAKVAKSIAIRHDDESQNFKEFVLHGVKFFYPLSMSTGQHNLLDERLNPGDS